MIAHTFFVGVARARQMAAIIKDLGFDEAATDVTVATLEVISAWPSAITT